MHCHFPWPNSHYSRPMTYMQTEMAALLQRGADLYLHHGGGTGARGPALRYTGRSGRRIRASPRRKRLPFAIIASWLWAASEEIAEAGRRGDRRPSICNGRRVVPGFNDAHVHFFWGGQSLTSVRLTDAPSKEEFRRRIADFARTRPAGEWIVDGNWDEEKWSPPSCPRTSLIDDVTPNNPVWVNRSDGHMMLANALAMKLAGITRETKDVPGGEIVRDKDGNPTGIFKDAAKDLVERVIPPPSDAQVDDALLAAQNYALENGVTSVQDMGFTGSHAADMQALIVRGYQRLLAQGKLKVRVSARFPLRPLSTAGCSRA